MSEYIAVFYWFIAVVLVWLGVIYSEVKSFKIDDWKKYFSNRKDAVKDVFKVLAVFAVLILGLKFLTEKSEAAELNDYRVRLSLGVDQPFNNRSNQCVEDGESQVASNMYASYAALVYDRSQYGFDIHHESCAANDDASRKSVDDYGMFYRYYKGKNAFHVSIRSSKVTYLTFERILYRKEEFSIDFFLQTTKVLNFKDGNSNAFSATQGENVFGLYINYHGNFF